MKVLAQNRQSLPLWFLLSILFHILVLLIPLFPFGKGGDTATVGEIELVEVGSPGSGSQVEIGGEGIAVPDVISLPQTQPQGAETGDFLSQPKVDTAVENAPQVVQPGNEGTTQGSQQVATGKPVPAAGSSQLETPTTGSRPPGDLPGTGLGKGESTTSGTGNQGTGAGGGGGDGGPSVPGTRPIVSTKSLMNASGNTISLFTIVELRPDGSYKVLEPIQEGSPATLAAKREFSKLEPDLRNYVYHKPYKLKLTFNYYPGKGQGQMEFEVLD